MAGTGPVAYISGCENFAEYFSVLNVRAEALIVVFGLIAGIGGVASASSELRGWRTLAGKPPSKSEFAAVLAACEDRVKGAEKSGAIEGCLADYGLRRVQ